jgi:hypothetical protein
MVYYYLGGQEFAFPFLLPEVAPFKIPRNEDGTAFSAIPFISSARQVGFSQTDALICQIRGWVAFAWRDVQVWSTLSGFLVRVEGGRDFYVGSDGNEIRWQTDGLSLSSLNETDRQILLGPVIVLALALRGSWSLHASAAIYKDTLILFLGESGQGKSTLAAYLAKEAGWRLAADDILPVTMGTKSVLAWPRFPQLKLPIQAQPGPGLPEQLSICKVCVLADAGLDELPALERLPASQAIQAYLGHTAGTRLFAPDLLGKHLAFCSQAAGRAPVYRLTYPHRWEALPVVKDLLENIC